MSEWQELTGQVEKLLPGGEALVRSEGSVFLVANAIPGDTVVIQPMDKRRGSQRAALQKILITSPVRIKAACPIADMCGGCSLQYLEPAQHAEVKSEWVLDIFRDFLESSSIWLPAIGQRQSYRRRVRWFIDEDAAGVFLGFKERASHKVIRQPYCMVVSGLLNQLRETIESAIAQDYFHQAKSVQALELSDGIHVIVEYEKTPVSLSVPCSVLNSLPVQWWFKTSSGTIPMNRPVATLHDRIALDDNEIDIRIGPDDFVQGQAEGNRQMICQVLEWGKQAKVVVDLFSGVGNLSLPFAKALGVRVIGAELNQASVQAANANAKRLGLNAKYQQVNLFETFDAEPFAGADLLILDPPRRGAKKICQMMGTLLPKKIVMINCDPASGGRDAATLYSLGYKLHTLRALDLFPYAGHVEAMGLWIR